MSIAISLPDIYSLIICSTMLIISAVSDLLKHKIWLPVSIGAPVIYAVCIIVSHTDKDWMGMILGMLLVSAPYLIMALAHKGGGGDAVLAAGIGFMSGMIDAVYIVLIASFVYMCFALCLFVRDKIRHTDKVNAEYPYAPFLLIGWAAFLLIICI